MAGYSRDRSLKRPLLIVGLLCLLGQIIIAPHIELFQGHINFCLVGTCTCAFMTESKSGALAGFIFGFAHDLLSVTPFGTMALILTVVGFFAGFIGRNLFSEGLSRTVALFVPAAITAELLSTVFMLSLGGQSGILTTLGLRMIPSIFLNILAASLVFFFITRMRRTDNATLRRSMRTIR